MKTIMHNFLRKKHHFFLNLASNVFLCGAKSDSIFVSDSAMTTIKNKLMKGKEAGKKGTTPGSIKLLILLLFVASFFRTEAQGWQVSFGGNGEDQGQALIQAVDHGFVLVGFSESYGADNDLDVFVVRTDADGKLVWANVYDEGFIEHGYDLLETADNGLIIVGDIYNSAQDPGNANVYLLRLDKRGRMLWSRQFGGSGFEQGLAICAVPGGGYAIIGRTKDTSNGQDDILLVRVDENGNELWTKTYGGNGDDRGTAIVALEDGFAFTGYATNIVGGIGNDIVLYRVDAEGAILWREVFGTSGNEEAHALIRTYEGNLALAGSINNYNDAFVAKYNLAGNLLWTRIVGYGGLGDEAFAIQELPDRSLVIAGRTETSASNTDILLAKLDANGNQIWLKALGDRDKLDTGEDFVATKAGGFAVIGYNALDGVFFNDLTLTVADGSGNIITNTISGKVFRDQGSCQLDPTDTPLEGWLVQATSANRTYFGVTDAQGNYSILTDLGTYQVSLVPRVAEYWQNCVPGGYLINLSNAYDTAQLNFPVFQAINCPFLEVDITAPYLQYCSQVEYTVHYRNLGPGVGQSAAVEVTLGNTLNFVSSSIPGTVQGNKVTFQLGNVASTSSGSFTFLTNVPCEGILVGSAALVSALITPNEPCTPPNPNWDGASIKVSAQCEADSIRFFIRNDGDGGMEDPGNYIIIEDQVLLIQEPFQLDAGMERQKTVPNTGATYRLVAEQSAFHPGQSYPTVAVEGCTQTGAYTTGQVTQFPEDDQDSFIDIDVQEIVGSNVLPADLRGYPKGYGDSFLISPNTDITYILFFANTTGTDTIDRIVIRDTLSALLNVHSIVPGSSSHPYRWEVYGNGILKITFDDVQLLPGGSAADSTRQGFVKFKVSQKPNNPEGAQITNRAAVFFDNYAPWLTNATSHQIGTFPQFITVSTDEPEFVPGVKINVFPNPFVESAVFEVEGMEVKEAELLMYDGNGRVVERKVFFGNRLEYHHKNRLMSGVYFYLLRSEGRLLNSGKITVR